VIPSVLRLGPGHRCNKAVAAPGNRLDAADLLAIAIERTAQCRNLDCQVIVVDHHPRPGGRHNLVPRDEVARPLDQHAENAEGARADFDRRRGGIVIPPGQAAPVKAEPPEQKNVDRGKCSHAPALPCASEFAAILGQFRIF